MYNSTIAEQIKTLVKAKLISPDDQDEAEATLAKKYWHDKIAVVWSIQDVIDRASERGLDLDTEAATSILKDMHRHHDAQMGINWETVDAYIDQFEQDELDRISTTNKKDLPMLIGTFKSKAAQNELELQLRNPKRRSR